MANDPNRFFVLPSLEALEDRLCLSGHPMLAEPGVEPVPAKHGQHQPDKSDGHQHPPKQAPSTKPPGKPRPEKGEKVEKGAPTSSVVTPVPQTLSLQGPPAEQAVSPSPQFLAIPAQQTASVATPVSFVQAGPPQLPAPLPVQMMIELDRAFVAREATQLPSDANVPTSPTEANPVPEPNEPVQEQREQSRETFIAFSLALPFDSPQELLPEVETVPDTSTPPSEKQATQEAPKPAPGEATAPLEAHTSDILTRMLQIETSQVREEVQRFFAHFVDLDVFGTGEEGDWWWDAVLGTSAVASGVLLGWLLHRRQQMRHRPERIVWSNEPSPWEVA